MQTFEEKYNWFLLKSGVDYKDYQHKGVEWCVKRETEIDPQLPTLRGGIIADEMGLGKTIMMIATFLIHFLPKTLIVLPNVILDQWRTEILRTTGHKVLIYHGPNKKKITHEMLQSATIVLTTYHTIANNLKKPNNLLHEIHWDRLVFDEAHHLRNKTSIYIGAKMLQSNVRWLISGTPIQNRFKDFSRLCSVLQIPAGFYGEVDNFKYFLKNFVMKRSKKEVGIVLPELTIHSEPVSWANLHERKMSHRIHTAVTYAHSFEKLKWMLFARQACILPRLLKTDAIIASPESYQGFTKIHSVISAVLSNKDNGNGKLIFCHFREEIDIIVSLLREAGIQKVCYFDGRVSQAQRTRYLAQQFEVIVLQIQTGCEGLNLQKGYSEIYFVSPHWNPAVEDQAVARCHRIGQIKPVHVYKFYMDHFEEDRSLTLDQYISHMQQDKREISNKVFA